MQRPDRRRRRRRPLVHELVPDAEPEAPDGDEARVRRALATIPEGRLREAGIWDVLLELSGVTPAASDDDQDEPDDLDEMDADRLIELALGEGE